MSPALQASCNPVHSSFRPDTSRPVETLVALMPEEIRLFFPDGFSGISGQVEECDTHALNSIEWGEILKKHRPRVLLSGWTTPMLPSECAQVCGGSVDYVCHVAGSVRQVAPRDLIACGLKVSNWGSLVATQVAEHALLLILAAQRNLSLWPAFMRSAPENQQKSSLGTRTLTGKRVAIHGFGAVARELIRLLEPFRVQVSVFSQGVPPDYVKSHGAIPLTSLKELAVGADVFVECEALTPGIQGCIDASLLASLPEGSAFVNVGRGTMVGDEVSLAEAARSRGLRVACDVFQHEPLPPDSPLFALPGAVLSPHIAGPTNDGYATCGAHALKNIQRYFEGLPIKDLVTTEIFDRST